MRYILSSLLLTLLLQGCAQYENRRGLEVNWDGAQLQDFVIGQTSRADVLERLGPPSQLIALGDETVFYYLFEHARGQGLILLAYNRFDIETRYDRAVFIFDGNDRLVDYASHVQEGNE